MSTLVVLCWLRVREPGNRNGGDGVIVIGHRTYAALLALAGVFALAAAHVQAAPKPQPRPPSLSGAHADTPAGRRPPAAADAAADIVIAPASLRRGGRVSILPRPRPADIRAISTYDLPRLLSEAKAQKIARALSAMRRGRFALLRAEIAAIADPLSADVLRWLLYRQPGGGSFGEINALLARRPDWPGRTTLLRRAEAAMPEDYGDEQALAWFADNPPSTTGGMVRYGELLLAAGREEEARTRLRYAWIHGEFSARQERAFLRKHKSLLLPEDHVARLDRLIWGRSYRAARRMLPRVDDLQRRIADARIRLAARQGGVDAAIARIPEKWRNDPGLVYERVKWRRKKRRHDEAQALLLTIPRPTVQAQKWWIEQGFQARKLLAKGYISDAYRIASNHGLTVSSSFAEAEFLAGWIALRFLGDGKIALHHFQKLYKAVRYPISKSRAAFWTAEAFRSLGRAEEAKIWYERAGTYPTTFYGQLAAARLGRRSSPPLPRIRFDERSFDAFIARDFLKATRILAELRQWGGLRLFFRHMIRQADTAKEHAMIAAAARRMGRKDIALMAAKESARHGYLLPEDAYPLLDSSLLPPVPVETALLHAVIRQESAYDREAVSAAGARGLMQLMPRTARHVARKNRLPYRKWQLTQDPMYNVTLGAAYLAELLDKFDGSYILAIAAYNAGSANVKRWIRDWGDPRRAGVDPVDWIEMIPYSETRNYVQRVLENLQIYRSRLQPEQQNTELRLALDLGDNGIYVPENEQGGASGAVSGCSGC